MNSLRTYCDFPHLTMGYCPSSNSFTVQSSDYFQNPNNRNYTTEKKIVYAALSQATGTYMLTAKQRKVLSDINSQIDIINKTESMAISHIKDKQDLFDSHLDRFLVNGNEKDVRELKNYFSNIPLINEETLPCDSYAPLSADQLNYLGVNVVKGLNDAAVPYIALNLLIDKVECVARITFGALQWQCGVDDPARKVFDCKPAGDFWEPMIGIENQTTPARINALLRGETLTLGNGQKVSLALSREMK